MSSKNEDYFLPIIKTVLYDADAIIFNIINENNAEAFFYNEEEIDFYAVLLKFYRKTHKAPSMNLVKEYYEHEGDTDFVTSLFLKLKNPKIKTYKASEMEGFIRLQNRIVTKDRLVTSLEAMIDLVDTSPMSELDENIDDLKRLAITSEIAIEEEQNVERLLHSAVNAQDIFKQKYEVRKKLGGKKVCNYGYEFMDATTGGLMSTDLISIIGYAKQFKSTFLRNLVRKFLNQVKNVLYITIEMSYDEIEDWFLTMHGNDRKRFPDGSRFTYKEVGAGTVEDEDFMYKAFDDLVGAEDLGILYILKPSGMYTYDRFTGDLIRVENSFVDIDIVAIDSINLMEDSQMDSINDLIRRIRQLSLSKNDNLGIPILSPFQINRSGYTQACSSEGNLYTPDAIRQFAEVEMSSTNVYAVIQTPEMKESKLVQVQHLISRENDLFKATRLSVDPEVGLMKEIVGGSESIDYVEDSTANEIVELVSKNLFT